MAVLIGVAGYFAVLACLCALVGATRRKEQRILQEQWVVAKRR
jgi:hypothetical protein